MDDAAGNSSRTRRREPKKKYIEMLQKVADRQLTEVCIELDDLDTVSLRGQ
jgi:DNA replication licensing factor MCM7